MPVAEGRRLHEPVFCASLALFYFLSLYLFCIKCVVAFVALFFITFILFFLSVAKSQCQGVGHHMASLLLVLLMHIYRSATASLASSMHK